MREKRRCGGMATWPIFDRKERSPGARRVLPWLASSGISSSSASNYVRMAQQISSAGNLKSSIRATLELLPVRTAKPKSAPKFVDVKIFKPTTGAPKKVNIKVTAPDLGIEPGAETISALEKELYGEREKVADLEERNAIMTETADPEAQKTADTINNQRQLIKTLKASVSEWQGKASAARKEITMLKRRIKGSKRRPHRPKTYRAA